MLRYTDDGELLVRVVRVETKVLKVTHRLCWFVTFSDERVAYTRREDMAQFLRGCRDDVCDVLVTLECETWRPAVLPPVIVTVIRLEQETELQPF